MLSEEEKEAIERLEKRIKDNEDYKTTQVWLTDDVSAVYTVLNMLKDLQRENIQKDKQIDLMAEYISKIDIEEDVCMKNKTNPDWCNEDHTKCKDCIKQYFERKSEE